MKKSILAFLVLVVASLGVKAVEIQDMTELATFPATGDLLVVVDVSDTTDSASGTGKNIQFGNLLGSNLLIYAGITPSANVQSILAAANYAAVLSLLGVEAGATADQSDAEIETAYNNQVAAASQAEMEAGTETAIRRMSPLRVSQAIAALAGAGTDDQTAAEVPFSPAGTIASTDVQAAIEEVAAEAGGFGVALDLADDDSDESAALTEIAVTNDPGTIITEPSADKMLINLASVMTSASDFTGTGYLLVSGGANRTATETGLQVDGSNNITGANALNTESLRILDNVDQSHGVTIAVDEDLAADYLLNYRPNGAARAVDMSGNLTVTNDVTVSNTNTGDQSGSTLLLTDSSAYYGGSGTSTEAAFALLGPLLTSTKKYTETFTILEPNEVQAITPTVVFLKEFPVGVYPSGATLTRLKVTSPTSYTSEPFQIEIWDDETDGTPSVAEIITLTGATSATDDGTFTTATIPANGWLALRLDSTPEDHPQVMITASWTRN